MSDQLRELVRPFGDVEPPLDLRSRISELETLVSGRRPPIRIPRMIVVATAAVGVLLVIGALALAAHSRSTAPSNEGSNTRLRPVTQAQFDAFVNLLAPRISQLQSHITIAREDLDIYMAHPSVTTGQSPARALGARLVHVAEDIDGSDYPSFTAVTAPRELTVAWSNFKDGVKETASAIRVGGFDVQGNKLPFARNDKRGYISRLEQPILRLKAALAAYATLNHFRLPSWVDKLGTSK